MRPRWPLVLLLVTDCLPALLAVGLAAWAMWDSVVEEHRQLGLLPANMNITIASDYPDTYRVDLVLLLGVTVLLAGSLFLATRDLHLGRIALSARGTGMAIFFDIALIAVMYLARLRMESCASDPCNLAYGSAAGADAMKAAMALAGLTILTSWAFYVWAKAREGTASWDSRERA